LPYNNDKKVIFLHIPKTGGTIIKKLFGINKLDDHNPANIPSPQHLTCTMLREYIGSEKYDTYYKFTFVRNPWARILSHYFWRQKLEEKWASPTFSDFIANVQKIVQEERFYEHEYGDHFIPQVQYTSDVNNIFKFEEFEKGVNILSKRLGINSGNYRPREKKEHDQYWEYYDKKSRRIIEQLYSEEIEQFGYEYGDSQVHKNITKSMSHNESGRLNPTFSVIIPSYNLGETLRRTVDSVMGQSLSGIELIIVDDASTCRDTIDFLNVLESTSIKVIFLEHNGGVAHARNVGIKSANAPYILCLDSDDYIDHTYLQKARKIFLERKEIGIVSPWIKFFGDFNNIWKCREEFSVQELIAGNQLPSGSCVRKRVYEDLNYYDENRDLSGLDDWDLWIRVFTQTKWQQTVIPETLFFYRTHLKYQQHSTMSDDKLEAALRVIVNNNSTYIQKYSEDIFVYSQILATRNRLRINMLLRDANNS
jgi:glycosyltransferase involved in cell wall biosynthesis